MEDPDLMGRLAIALAIGFLLGLERGWRERAEPAGRRTAGVRTFSLLGLGGGVTGALLPVIGGTGFGLVFVASAAALTVFMFREAWLEQDYSATSLVAALLAFLLGALAVAGATRAAGAGAVAATTLLALKDPLHSWLARVTWPELKSVLLLATMTFILLPLLPDRALDPWGAINPHRLWLMVILIAAVSFAGYGAIALAGPRQGPLLAALAGGSVASTAFTLTFARLSRENPGQEALLGASIVIAGCVMMLRVGVVVGIVNPALLPAVGLPLSAAALTTGAWTWWRLARRTSPGVSAELRIENPFELVEVVKFGALLAGILLASRIVAARLGDWGMYGLAVVSGVADVDAITLAAATLRDAEGGDAAARVILLAVLTNTFSKAMLAGWSGGMALGLRVLRGALLAACVGGGVASWLEI